jgi:hypothetical protein
MLTIVCFKWKRNTEGYQLASVVNYGPKHVINLERMLKRYVRVPFRFFCITDDPKGMRGIRTIPLWDKCRNLGGCFNRLYLFSKDMETIIGERFVAIDLDCVITQDITDLLLDQSDFRITAYQPMPNTLQPKDQHYNGSMIMMNAGARSQVWETFDPETSPEFLKTCTDYVGSDQAWIRHVLGKGEKRFGPEDGVYEFRNLREGIPENARIVFLSGKRDPSMSKQEWIRRNWR